MTLYNVQASVTGRGTVQAKAIAVKRAGGSIAGSGAFNTRTFTIILRAKGSLTGRGTVSTRGFIKRSFVRLSAQGIGRVIVNAETWKFKGIKAQMQGKSALEFYRHDRDIYKYLSSYMPPYYDAIKQVQALRQALSPEFTRLQAIIQDIFRQFIVNEATWGLDYWDPNSGNEAVEKRRKRIMDILASQTFTNARIRELVGYGCEISEQFNEFLTDILITEVRGEPGNVQEILQKLDQYFPSHAGYQLRYSYLPWDELDEANLTWDQVSSYTWTRLETTFLR